MQNIRHLDKKPEPLLDVAIIGGGVSGAYAAYRLMKTKPCESSVIDRLRDGKQTLAVGLYERGDRIGGRLWSYQFPELPDHIPAEMGGMAFHRLMQSVWGLCKEELHLELVPFTAYPELEKIKLFYLRDQHYGGVKQMGIGVQEDLEDRMPDISAYFLKRWGLSKKDQPSGIPSSRLRYFLKQDEERLFPSEFIPCLLLDSIEGDRHTQTIKKAYNIINDLGERKIKAEDAVSRLLKEWNYLRRFLRSAKVIRSDYYSGSDYVCDVSFWQVFEQVFSTEACNFIRNTSGMDTPFYSWNLYDAFLYFSWFGLWPQFERPLRGYSSLPQTLVRKFQKMGGQVHMQHQLQRLDLVEYGGEQLIKLTLNPTNVRISITVYAKNVVLALAQQPILSLDRDSFIFESSQFRRDVDSVQAEASSKLFLTYADPWWINMGLHDGRSVTDLPMMQCLYMGSQGDNVFEGSEGKSSVGPGLLMASYNDGISTGFWDIYRITDPPQAPPEMKQEIHRQLTELHQEALKNMPKKMLAKMVEDKLETYLRAAFPPLPGEEIEDAQAVLKSALEGTSLSTPNLKLLIRIALTVLPQEALVNQIVQTEDENTLEATGLDHSGDVQKRGIHALRQAVSEGAQTVQIEGLYEKFLDQLNVFNRDKTALIMIALEALLEEARDLLLREVLDALPRGTQQTLPESVLSDLPERARKDLDGVSSLKKQLEVLIGAKLDALPEALVFPPIKATLQELLTEVQKTLPEHIPLKQALVAQLRKKLDGLSENELGKRLRKRWKTLPEEEQGALPGRIIDSLTEKGLVRCTMRVLFKNILMELPRDILIELLTDEDDRIQLPKPISAVYQNWMRKPFGGAWHFWKPRVRSWEVIPRIRQPVPGCNVFLCGEAFSAQQAWAEGAINTAEMVLETYFGLPRPDWVDPEYDFGP